MEYEPHKLIERCKNIPLRLTDHERSLLQILEGALEISEYTDNVDVSSTMYRYRWERDEIRKKSTIMQKELKKMLSFILGLHVSSNFQVGQKLVEGEYSAHEEYFKNIMEIGRRYKITSPEKMRTTYGKLMHIMQDAVTPGLIDIDIMSPIKCVYDVLKTGSNDKGSAVAILEDENMEAATFSIVPGPEMQIRTEQKKAARNNILTKYKDHIPQEMLTRILDSITDSNAYLMANRHPVDKMIGYLKEYFKRDREEEGFSLEIRSGKGGSELSHNHATQYTFVLQSLELWREIQDQMYYLWRMADADLLGKDSYALVDTGQGLNRMQGAPKVSRAMSSVLSRVKSRVGGWVGLSVVHLGDRDVPNALVFIDKYTQVPRILAPIVQTIDRIESLEENPKTKPFLDEFGSVDSVRKTILCDFFKHGFDGSGDDGGSCVDGRLTSAWNWCSKIDKKEYYPIFLMTGFYGFDGSFKK